MQLTTVYAFWNRVPGVTGGSATIAPWPEHAAVLALPCAGQLVPEASALSDQDDLNPHEIAEAVEAFALGLPLGSGRAAAEVEAAVSRRLLDAEVSRSQLRQRLRKWMQVAQELQQLVERQQDELKVAEACCDDVRRHQQSQVGAWTQSTHACVSAHMCVLCPHTCTHLTTHTEAVVSTQQKSLLELPASVQRLVVFSSQS